VRRPLDIQVAVGRAPDHQRQHDLAEQLALQVRVGRDRFAEPFVDLGHAVLGDGVPAALGPGLLLDRAGDRLPVPGQPGQRRVDLAVPQLPLAEVRVVVPFQVIAVARPALKQPRL
jgi:hypothetical protein